MPIIGRRVLLLALLVVVISGCVGRMVSAVAKGPRVGEMVVSSYADRAVDPRRATYCLFPYDPGVSSGDLVYRDIEVKVDKALSIEGMARATTVDSCEQAIFIGYGDGTPATAIGSAQMGRVGPLTSGQAAAPESAVAQVAFSRWLVMTSVDRRAYIKNGDIQEIWKTVASVRESRYSRKQGLGHTVSYLLVGSMDYIGRHSPEGRHVRIRTRNEDWKALSEATAVAAQ